MSISIAAGGSAVTYMPKAAYVANAGSNSVSQYTIGTSGALTPMTLATVATGTLPRSIIVDPSGKYAYVANYNSNNVSAYTIDPVTRALTPASGSPFAAGTSPTAVSIDPSGRFVYVSNYGWPSFGSVSAYTVNAATGALTAIAGSPFAAGNGSSSIDVDPSGRFVYTSNLLNDTITAFSINPSTGVLTGLQGLSVTNARPVSIATDPTGRFVYAATACGTTWVFGINTATGSLTRADADPGGLCFGSPNAPDSLAIDPSGRTLYMTGYDVMSQVSAQAIDKAAGTLTAVAGSPFSTGNGTNSVTVDLSGKYVYATGSAGVYQFTIGAAGALTPMTAATAAAGSSPASVTTFGTIQ
jgi:YVTN family beta-propeller protein